MRKDLISSLYRLSPLQEGMLFHSLYDRQSLAYQEQMVADFPDGFSLPAFKAAWAYVLKNHSILRSSFIYDELSVTVQCVYKKVEVPLQFHDFSGKSGQGLEDVVQQYMEEDRRKGFDFANPPLMRIAVLKLGPKRMRMVWSFHHILLDGWSMPLLFGEWLGAYETLAAGGTPPEIPEDRYEDFIKYIQSRDKHGTEAFWRGYMEGLEGPTLLPFIQKGKVRNKGGLVTELKVPMGMSFTDRLTNFAKNNHLTINSVLQGVWAFLLARYTGQEQVVFGATVSGRPTDLPRAEKKVGLFINTLPFHAILNESSTTLEWLQSLQKGHTQAREHQFTAISDIQNWAGITGDLFDSLLVYENYPINAVLGKQWNLKIENLHTREQTNYLLTIVAGKGDELVLRFGYDTALLNEGVVEQISRDFQHVLKQFVAQPGHPISSHSILDEQGEEDVLEVLNGPDTEWPDDTTLVELFERQVQLRPEATAVKCQGQELSYKELNASANRLAHWLREKGVGPDHLVGICLDRSLDMTVGMLAILKAGGAYVPIDPLYPHDRIAFVLQDIEAQVLLTDALNHAALLEHGVPHTLDISTASIMLQAYPEIAPEVKPRPEHLAYVIYTSGSTGRPKGVLIPHRNVVRLFFHERPLFDFDESDVWVQFHSFCFDFSVWEMYGALLHGGHVVHVPHDVARDPHSFAQLLVEEKVTVLNQTPGAFYALQTELLRENAQRSIRYVIFGGEALNPALLAAWHERYPNCQLINMYGITETTVHVTYKEMGAQEIADGSSNIGRPIPTLKAYVLDRGRHLLPPGAAGELFVGGAGVARSYLNRPELTHERFVENPFSEKGKDRLYRTGDLVRLLPSGDLEYLGRIDQQVKIRGYRIELGEIETVLQKSEQVRQGVVLSKPDPNGKQRLIAYLVPKDQLDRAALMDELRAKLPDYMVPFLIVELASLPLTANGKTDRKALPNPDASELLQKQFVAPRNQAEADMAEIWKGLLKVEQVGIYDNFFELGGDSIITIQVVSRAKRKGMALSPRDLFTYPTIAELLPAMAARSDGIPAEQGQLSGKSGLLPIQQWLLKKDLDEPHHYNQSVLLGIPKTLPADLLGTALEAVVAHHDALHFRYRHEDGQWVQEYAHKAFRLSEKDFRKKEGTAFANELEEVCADAQSSLHLEKGNLFKAILFKSPASESQNRLFLLAHHLLVDGVSWRIFLDHLSQAIQALEQAQEVDLGPKTNSFRQWHDALKNMSPEPRWGAQIPYWEALAEPQGSLPVDHNAEESTAADLEVVTVEISKENTQQLLTTTHQAYRTETNDLLLSALAQSVGSWTGYAKVLVGLEGHGREEMETGLDLTETMGWFTNLYPVALPTGQGNSDPGDLIKSVKESLRAIPDKGLGFGMLRYLHPHMEVRSRLQDVQWEIVFNYLGQIDNQVQQESIFSPASEATGQSVANSFPMAHRLEVNGFVADGALQFSFRFSRKDYRFSTIQALADGFSDSLARLIDHCIEKQVPESTPSDHGLNGWVDHREFSSFLSRDINGKSLESRTSGIYRLSATQEGLLFHGLYDPESVAYRVQLIVDFSEGLDLHAFEKSWDYVLRKHSILRSAFFFDALSIPVQCVFDDVSLPMDTLDLSGLKPTEQRQRLDAFLDEDRCKSFDFEQPPLMRITFVKLGEQAYQMAWTYHHILFDGWSKPILVEDLLTAYEHFANGQQLPAMQEDRYHRFIEFLNARDSHAEERFWREYLQGVESGSLLPFVPETAERNRGGTQPAEQDHLLDFGSTDKIVEFARRHHITVNTLVQSAWAMLLSRYTGRDDVLFAVTVSGRPSELSGAENMVGLFINSIPFRVRVDPGAKLMDWLREVQEQQTAAREFQHSALSDIQKWSDFKGEMFDSIFVFENYPLGEVLSKQWSLKAAVVQAREASNYLLTVTAVVGKKLRINFNYNSALLSSAYVSAMGEHLEELLMEMVNNAGQRLANFPILSSAQQERVLAWGGVQSHSAKNLPTLPHQFQTIVTQRPETAALTCGNRTLSYQELDALSTNLAQWLRGEMSVEVGEVVGILCDRTERSIVAVLGILKAGAAFLPLDPQLPAARIQFMLRDAGVKSLLLDSAHMFSLEGFDGNMFALDLQLETLPERSGSSLPAPEPDDLAYAIYTSGSSGQPKGVLVEHGNLSHYLNAARHHLASSSVEGSGSLFHLPLAFDASLTALFLPLSMGRKVVVSQGEALEVFADPAILEHVPYDFIKLTPAHLKVLEANVSPEALPGLTSCYVIGGEALYTADLEFLQQADKTIRIVNEYGPTEATVGCVAYAGTFEEGLQSGSGGVSIGRPMEGNGVYVLDQSGALAAVGVPGELCIAGPQVARGYLNRPELNKQKFVPDRFGKGRMYRSGDRARWLPDGSLEFMGRMDAQVKINGYRIEPGEIEAALGACAGVRQAAVRVYTDNQGRKRLLGYLRKDSSASLAEIQLELEQHLPAYMIPTQWVELDQFPLTPNGKIDRKALSDPDAKVQDTYVAPSTEAEQALCAIWQELLAAERIGIHDNFFELGGDSIITIQVVSRARRAGFGLKPYDVFQHPTIAELAQYVEAESEETDAEQGILEGQAPLLPIQQWFLNKEFEDRSHFNQSLLLEIDKSFDYEAIAQVVKELMRRHDSLRFSYRKDAQKWVQKYETNVSVLIQITCESVSKEDLTSQVERICRAQQRDLNLESGELFRLVWITTPEHEDRHRLLFLAHHLLVDGVSWRILLQDLQHGLEAVNAGRDIEWGIKTSSYRQFGEHLRSLVSQRRMQAQLPYWRQVQAAFRPLPTEKQSDQPITAAQTRSISLELDATTTAALLQKAGAAYNSQVDDLLMAALAQTLCSFAEREQLVVGMEGHGRESLGSELDLSETVGWFTNMYPVLLKAPATDDHGDWIVAVKEQLREVPDKGMGYGILRYLDGENGLDNGTHSQPWDVVFNYLGQLDGAIQESPWLSAASEGTGGNVAGSYPIAEKLVINSSVQTGQLRLSWSFSPLEFEEASIERLGQQYLLSLRELVQHCLAKPEAQATPSDYGLTSEISPEELNRFLDVRENGIPRRDLIRTVCHPSPIQEGMLFHALYDPNSEAYIVQLLVDFDRGLDLDAFDRSWKYVMRNHSVFRSAFFQNEMSRPVQVIYKDVKMPFRYLDLRHLNEEEKDREMQHILHQDREERFDFRKPPMMRSILLHLDKDVFKLIWTSHHIIADGWSKPILFREFMMAYDHFARGNTPPEVPEDRYEDFITYINSRDKFAEEDFWKSYLEGFEEPTLLPFTSISYGRNSGTGIPRERNLDFSVEFTREMEEFARRQQITLNTLFQGVWFILLSRYTGTEDMVCGVTVSGRPADYDRIEDRIGLFIHTLPIRAQVAPGQKASEWLRSMHASQTRMREFQYTPLSTIQGWQGIQGDLFDNVLVFENYPPNDEAQEEQLLKPAGLQTVEHTNYMLTLLGLVGDSMTIRFGYNSSLLKDEIVEMIMGHFDHVVRQIVAQPELNLKDLSLMPSAEIQMLTQKFNDIPSEFEVEGTMADMFEACAEKMPENIAVQFGQESLSYAQLNEKANRVAHFLVTECKVQPGEMVPLLTTRGPAMVVAMMAVFKAGACYAPLNPEFPQERLVALLNTTKARTVLATHDNVDLCDRLQWEADDLETYVCIDGKTPGDYVTEEKQSRSLWDYVADKSDNAVAASGWISSYTGEYMSELEIGELVGNVQEKLSRYLTSDAEVLEVGCGSGLILMELARMVRHFTGTDISASVLEQVRKDAALKGFTNVDLYALTANEIDRLPERKYDVILLNSVVQYFPSLRYLRDFIDKARGLLKEDGVLFLGDIRDKSLQTDFYESLYENDPNQAFLVKEKRRKELELFLDKDWFFDHFGQMPEPTGLEVSKKTGTVKNELLRYRYDVLVQFGKAIDLPAPKGPGKRQVVHFPAKDYPSHHPTAQRNLDQPAYLIFTSGTTGKPKGVVIPHRALTNFLKSMALRPGISPEDSVLSVSTYTFDISVLDFLLPLSHGAKLILTPQDTILDPGLIKEIFEVEQPTWMQAVPTYWRMLVENGWKGADNLKTLSGGEPIAGYMIEELVARSNEYWNCYGPTETTIYCSHQHMTGLQDGINVGQAMHNTTYYIFDEEERLVPVGVPGEIYIGGDLLALGYLDDPVLTEELFIDNPVNPGERVYKSGDIGKWRFDGRVEIVGRKDNQLKIRGFRIEAEEIELALQEHPDIAMSVVNAWTNNGQKELVAYLVAEAGCEVPDSTTLRAILAETLPDYMIPAHFVAMPTLPQTPRGKVNRKALPDPHMHRVASGADYQGPRDEREEQLADIWRQVLALDRVSVHDNFFDLGGHSLLAVRLMARINKTVQVHLPLVALFECPTIELLADRLARAEDSAQEDILIPINSNGPQSALFCAPGAGGNVLSFHALGQQLDGTRRVYAFQAHGVQGTRPPLESVRDMAEAYIAEMKKIQPAGPYWLAGYSFGGSVAYEMARQLQAQGEKVERLIIFDSDAPAAASHQAKALMPSDYEGWLLQIAANLHGLYGTEVPLHPDELAGMPREAQLRVLFDKMRARRMDVTLQQLKGFTNVYIANNMLEYVPQGEPLRDVPILLFRSTDNQSRDGNGVGSDLGWASMSSGQVQIVDLDAGHLQLLNAPFANRIAIEIGQQVKVGKAPS